MRRLMLFAGAAALAVTMPVLAKERGGPGRGHGQAAHGQQGHGNDRAERGKRGHGEARGQSRHERRAQRSEHRERRAERSDRSERREARAERRQRREARRDRRERHEVREARRDERQRRMVREARRDDRERRLVRQARREERRIDRDWSQRRMAVADRFDDDARRFRRSRSDRRFCPPGLARQNAWCMPPGQLRKARFIGQRLGIAEWAYNVPDRYRYRFDDSDRFFYRYGNDNAVYRFDRPSGLVSAVYPLMSTGLFPGEPLPLGYDVYNVPLAWRGYYPDTQDYLYRYDDSAIYRVDSETMLVEAIVAMLTGGVGGLGGLGIGDMLPSGYDAYNVPLDYRDDYYDTDEAMYRYADGSIYQVDPQSRLIEQVISLLV